MILRANLQELHWHLDYETDWWETERIGGSRGAEDKENRTKLKITTKMGADEALQGDDGNEWI